MLCQYWNRKNTVRNALVAAFLLSLVIVSNPRLSRADAVTDWNEITTQAILIVGRSPVITALDYAIVHTVT